MQNIEHASQLKISLSCDSEIRKQIGIVSIETNIRSFWPGSEGELGQSKFLCLHTTIKLLIHNIGLSAKLQKVYIFRLVWITFWSKLNWCILIELRISFIKLNCNINQFLTRNSLIFILQLKYQLHNIYQVHLQDSGLVSARHHTQNIYTLFWQVEFHCVRLWWYLGQKYQKWKFLWSKEVLIVALRNTLYNSNFCV